MLKKMHDLWSHFDDAFRSMDRDVRTLDWRSMDTVRHTITDDKTDPSGRRVHKLEAHTWRSRRRMTWLFLWLRGIETETYCMWINE